MNEQDTFWDQQRQGDGSLDDYISQISVDSAIPTAVRNRDSEMRVLAGIYCEISGADLDEVFKSRVNIRRKFLGEWSDDEGPFTDEEIRGMRSAVLPRVQLQSDAQDE